MEAVVKPISSLSAMWAAGDNKLP